MFVAAICAVPASQLPIIDGQRFLSPPIAALVVTFAPAIAAVLAAIAYRERLAARSVAGFAIALGGVAMIVVLGAGTGAQAEASDPLRASLALISPLAWAIYTLISKPLAERHHTIGIVGVTMIVGALSMAPLFPHAIEGARDLSAGGWAWLVFLAIGGSAGPYMLWTMEPADAAGEPHRGVHVPGAGVRAVLDGDCCWARRRRRSRSAVAWSCWPASR